MNFKKCKRCECQETREVDPSRPVLVLEVVETISYQYGWRTYDDFPSEFNKRGMEKIRDFWSRTAFKRPAAPRTFLLQLSS